MEYIKLPIKGQGIVVFKPHNDPSTNHHVVSFSIHNHDKTYQLQIQFMKDHHSSNHENKGHIVITITKNGKSLILEDTENNTGLINYHGAYYWFSLDSQNHLLYAGIGEPRMETVKYKYKLPQFPENIRKENKLLLESLSHIDTTNIHVIRITPDPITEKIPLIVKNTDDLSMDDIAKMTYMPKANLSLISQKLYDCISGKNFVLDDTSFPDFSKAIEYSIATEGCWCNTTLKKKANEFSKDKPNYKETYLRITLGQNNGESPGIPYVMEIWPPGHYSPVHNHAGANAIIRVLHGKIHVKLYPFLSAEIDGIPVFGTADFKENEITWISPTLNQTHQLVNHDDTQTCITIQCYMYDAVNNRHYDYFDYIDTDGHKQQYEPDSDMDFITFKQTIMNEWKQKIEKDHMKKTV